MQPGTFKLVKEGCVSLQFAPAVAVRQYDWSRKQVSFSRYKIYIYNQAFMGTLRFLGTILNVTHHGILFLLKRVI